MRLFSLEIIVYFTIGCLVLLNNMTMQTYAETKLKEENAPLRVVVRPRENVQKPEPSLINPEMLRRLNETGITFSWKNILNNGFYSGYQDEENLKKYGYSVNSEIGLILQNKMRGTDDADNMLHLNDYRNKQLYSGAPSVIINPMQEIQQGCLSKTSGKCGFEKYGQFWLKSNLRNIDNSKDRSDNSLANMVKSLD